jgi:peptide/nickel transport system ATP-binding protein
MPHELSGGEKQRVALARAFAAEPRVLLCDEVVSALDVSVQATIMELIRSYCERTKLTVVFVTHDLAVARMMSDRIAVFRHGSMCELGPADRIFAQPAHDYTRELVASQP